MKLAWLLPLLAVATPAQGAQPAASPPGLECPAGRLSPEQTRGVADAALSQAEPGDARILALFEVVDACGDQLSWSREKRRWAGLFTIATIAGNATRELLGRRGVRVERLDPLILSDPELMAAAEAGTITENVGRAFGMRHIAALERIAAGQELTRELGQRFGHYIAFRAMMDVSSRQFGGAR